MDDGHERRHQARFSAIRSAKAIEPCGDSVLGLSSQDGNLVLSQIPADGGYPTALASGDVLSPACSSDGKAVFYLNFAHPEKIRSVSVYGGSPREIADLLGDALLGNLAISPEGKFLAYLFQTYSPPRVAIALLPSAGGPVIKTFAVPGFVASLHWAPDGKSLHYLLARENATNLWQQPIGDGTPRQLTKFSSGQIFDFSWTKDGKHL